VTFTVKLHEKVCCRASVIVHDTVVVPIENASPDEGAQATDAGWTAADARGSANVTRTGWRFVDCAVTGPGHVTVAFVGGVGLLGSTDDPCVHPPTRIARTTTKKAARLIPRDKPVILLRLVSPQLISDVVTRSTVCRRRSTSVRKG
jgi:hypothetical protein